MTLSLNLCLLTLAGNALIASDCIHKECVLLHSPKTNRGGKHFLDKVSLINNTSTCLEPVRMYKSIGVEKNGRTGKVKSVD